MQFKYQFLNPSDFCLRCSHSGNSSCIIDCSGNFACSRSNFHCGDAQNPRLPNSTCVMDCSGSLSCMYSAFSCNAETCIVKCSDAACIGIQLVFSPDSHYHWYCDGYFSCYATTVYSPSDPLLTSCVNDTSCTRYESEKHYKSRTASIFHISSLSRPAAERRR